MALGAVFAWAWIPEVQNPRGSDAEDDSEVGGRGGREGRGGVGGRGRRRGRRRRRRYEVPSKSLEELALGRAAVVDEELKVGFRVRGRLLRDRIGRTLRRRRKVG
jgi:hypothetical protein